MDETDSQDSPTGRLTGRWPAAILALLTIGAGMLWTMFLHPHIHHQSAWFPPHDVWDSMAPAHYVANGALGYLYEASKLFVDPPLLPIVLAPIAFIGDLFHLTEPTPFFLPHPQMWLLYAPYALGLSVVLYLGVRSAARAAVAVLGASVDSGRLWTVLFAVLPLAAIPASVVYGHFEDVLAIGFVLFAASALMHEKPLRGALLLGVAIAFKQWAILGLPIVVAQAPQGERGKVLAAGLVIPGLLVAFPLLVDWHDTSRAMFFAQSFPTRGQAALWVSRTVRIYRGSGLPRLLIVALSVAAGWAMRDRRGPRALLAGLALVFLSRMFFEPVIFSYYVAPGFTLLAVHEFISHGRPWRTLALGIGALLWFLVHAPPIAWWAGFTAICVVTAWPAIRDVLRAPLPEGAASEEPTPGDLEPVLSATV